MLTITIPATEVYDSERNIFFNIEETTLKLEHSLVSLSKWESKWHKPFLTSDQKTGEETRDYIRCMTITQNVNPAVYNFIGNDIVATVSAYIESPMTATTFAQNDNHKINRDVITAEIIYYWMIALNIPFECQKWHLNRLLTLINVCNIKNQPAKKMNRKEAMERQRTLNAVRRAKSHSKG